MNACGVDNQIVDYLELVLPTVSVQLRMQQVDEIEEAKEGEGADLEHWRVAHLDGNEHDKESSAEVDYLVILSALPVGHQSDEILLNVLHLLFFLLQLCRHLLERLLLHLGLRFSHFRNLTLLVAER